MQKTNIHTQTRTPHKHALNCPYVLPVFTSSTASTSVTSTLARLIAGSHISNLQTVHNAYTHHNALNSSNSILNTLMCRCSRDVHCLVKNMHAQRNFCNSITGTTSVVDADVIYKIACTRGHTKAFSFQHAWHPEDQSDAVRVR